MIEITLILLILMILTLELWCLGLLLSSKTSLIDLKHLLNTVEQRLIQIQQISSKEQIQNITPIELGVIKHLSSDEKLELQKQDKLNETYKVMEQGLSPFFKNDK